jgi:SAM-dependent methyltransferase
MICPVADDRERLRFTFDEVAELYDEARPGYPERLLDDLVLLGRLTPSGSILEVGCGTGQATRRLAERGFDVLCVELGENLAVVARRNLASYRRVRVLTAAFESWDPGQSRFDMVFAATSFHWLDPAVRCERAAGALRPGGALAVIGGGHVLPNGGDPFFMEIQTAYDMIGESLPEGKLPRPGERSDARDEMEGSGLFGEVEVRRYLVERKYTAEAYIRLLETFSGHLVMDQEARALLYGAMRELIGRRDEPVIRHHTELVLTVGHLGGRSARSHAAV